MTQPKAKTVKTLMITLTVLLIAAIALNFTPYSYTLSEGGNPFAETGFILGLITQLVEILYVLAYIVMLLFCARQIKVVREKSKILISALYLTIIAELLTLVPIFGSLFIDITISISEPLRECVAYVQTVSNEIIEPIVTALTLFIALEMLLTYKGNSTLMNKIGVCILLAIINNRLVQLIPQLDLEETTILVLYQSFSAITTFLILMRFYFVYRFLTNKKSEEDYSKLAHHKYYKLGKGLAFLSIIAMLGLASTASIYDLSDAQWQIYSFVSFLCGLMFVMMIMLLAYYAFRHEMQTAGIMLNMAVLLQVAILFIIYHYDGFSFFGGYEMAVELGETESLNTMFYILLPINIVLFVIYLRSSYDMINNNKRSVIALGYTVFMFPILAICRPLLIDNEVMDHQAADWLCIVAPFVLLSLLFYKLMHDAINEAENPFLAYQDSKMMY